MSLWFPMCLYGLLFNISGVDYTALLLVASWQSAKLFLILIEAFTPAEG